MKQLLLVFVLVLTGCGGKFNIPGVSGPTFSTTEDHAITTLVLENIDFGGVATVEIPKIVNSYVEVYGIETGGTAIDFKIDLETITSGNVGTLEPMYLPGGRDIPVVGGSLPGVAFNIPVAQNVHVYLAKNIYGIFLPVDFPEEIQGTLIYTIKVNGKKYGNVAVIGKDSNGENSGVLILADLTTLSEKERAKLMKMLK
jgi:hypothetical protein